MKFRKFNKKNEWRISIAFILIVYTISYIYSLFDRDYRELFASALIGAGVYRYLIYSFIERKEKS